MINDSDQMRAVLIVDLARPVPPPLRPIAKFMEKTAALHYAPRVVGGMNALIPAPAGQSYPVTGRDGGPSMTSAGSAPRVADGPP